MTIFKVGYLIGSLAKESINRKLATALTRLAPEHLKFTEIPINDLPLYSYDYDAEFPPVAKAFKEAITAVDAVLFVTPEYNRSIPGGLKNAIDWASRPYGDSAWEGKPLAIMGASPGQSGTVRAQLQLRQAAIFLNMLPLNRPEVLVGRADTKFDASLNLTDEATRKFIQDELEAFARWIERLRLGLGAMTLPG